MIDNNKMRLNVSNEDVLRSKTPVVVCYKDGTIAVHRVMLVTEDNPRYRATASGKFYEVGDLKGIWTDPNTVAWIDTHIVARRMLRDYPLYKPSFFAELFEELVTFRHKLIGMSAAGSTPARAEAARANGALGGRPPKDPVKLARWLAARAAHARAASAGDE